MLNIISLSLVFARGESAADSRRDISTKKATKIILIFLCLQKLRRNFSATTLLKNLHGNALKIRPNDWGCGRGSPALVKTWHNMFSEIS